MSWALADMVAALSLFIWLYLVFAHGRFWSSTPELSVPAQPGDAAAAVTAPGTTAHGTTAAAADAAATDAAGATADAAGATADAAGATADAAGATADANAVACAPALGIVVAGATLAGAAASPVADAWPDVDIVVPARDEAETIVAVVGSLLSQEYPGRFSVTLVDDESTDGTATRVAAQARYRLVRGLPKPPGWSGKLWALRQGVQSGSAPLLLFTDADIVHSPAHLSTLVRRIQTPPVDMVSEMVRLNCESLAERLLVPAFVYFFQMLYPFALVNAAESRVAAAAGGTVLIRRTALERLGGIDAIRFALIDDVSLARAAKQFGPIYLGHTNLATSIRRYPQLRDIWNMIARTAFTQLRYSGVLLMLTVLGLTLTWLVPVAAVLVGHGVAFVSGAAACGLAAASYLPTLRRYRRSPLWALLLPLIALFYMAATIGSAVDYWRGAGAHWKRRAYGGHAGEAGSLPGGGPQGEA